MSGAIARKFVDELRAGDRIADIFAQPRFRPVRTSDAHQVVIEVKHEDDARNNEELYRRKLKLATEFYRSQGILFVTVMRTKDFDEGDIPRFENLTLDRHTTLRDIDFHDLRRVFAGIPAACSYGRLVRELGGGPAGRAKVAAFQINRKISIDLRRPVSDSSDVHLVI